MLPLPTSTSFPIVSQNLASPAPSMETYLHMVAAAAQQYAISATEERVPSSTPSSDTYLKLPQASPTTSSNNSEALDFRTNLYNRVISEEAQTSEEDEENEQNVDNPLDLSVGARKRGAASDKDSDDSISQMKMKQFKSASPTLNPDNIPNSQILPGVNPYLAAVAAANIFGAGQFPGWNGKSDLVVDPLEKMSDIVKVHRKDKTTSRLISTTNVYQAVVPAQNSGSPNSKLVTLPPSNEGLTKTRHNIWQSHWQNKGVANSVFRCVWCKQSFSTLEALTAHMKDSQHCGVNVPPFGNLPNIDRQYQALNSSAPPTSSNIHVRKQSISSQSTTPSSAAKAAFQYRGDPSTPLPRKLVRGQNVWLGKGVEQAMQILKCMRCGESFRSLGEMTKHMQETQHYTNILSQEQAFSAKTGSGDTKDNQNSLSSEENRTLSAVLTCKVCDKAFNSLGELSNHMAKNSHYAEPLMQSFGNSSNRKRAAPKKREKSLPVRKLLEMKSNENEDIADNTKRTTFEGSDKTDPASFAERMRQYITSVKSAEESKTNQSPSNSLVKDKSVETEPKNSSKACSGTSSVLSAIEQMFTTSFDAPPKHVNVSAASPSNSSAKNTSPVASSILKRLGIDENVDYNKPLIDTTDRYKNYQYTSSERSFSECSAEAYVENRKSSIATPEKIINDMENNGQKELFNSNLDRMKLKENIEDPSNAKLHDDKEIKGGLKKVDYEDKQPFMITDNTKTFTINGIASSNITHINKRESRLTPILVRSPEAPFQLPLQSSPDGHRSTTPKSPASSIKSFEGEKRYPSDSLNALSSMFDSLGSASQDLINSHSQSTQIQNDSLENTATSNSLVALRQLCVKKESTV